MPDTILRAWGAEVKKTHKTNLMFIEFTFLWNEGQIGES